MGFFRRLRFYELVLIGLVVILSILPFFIGITWQKVLIQTFILIFLCSAFNIGASAGQFNLMIGVGFGFSAYLSTILWIEYSFSPLIMFLVGPIVSVLVSLIIGAPLFKYKLPLIAFAIATLAFNEIASFVIMGTDYLGRTDGITFSFINSDPINFHWVTPLPYYYFSLTMVVAIVIFCRFIFRAKLGMYFKAIHQNEKAASAAGVDIFKYKMIALGITMALVGFSGNFWAHYKCFVNTETTVSLRFVLDLAVLTVIGGMGTLFGPVLASGIMVPIVEYAKTFGARIPGVDDLIYGAAVVAVLLSLKAGIIPWFDARSLRKHLAKIANSGTSK